MTFGIQGSNGYGAGFDWASLYNNAHDKRSNAADSQNTANGAGNTAKGADEAEDPQRNPLDPTQDENVLTGTDDDKKLSPEEEKAKASGHKSTPAECETCKRRKYQDGSDEMVSFKAAGHIDPGNAASVVMSHEQEHVSNAYQKAKDGNGEVVRASVRLKTAVCPECGRTYISGGETTTQIRYYNEDNPYQKDMKESDADNKYRGANVDIPA